MAYALDPELANVARFLPSLDFTDISTQRRKAAELFTALPSTPQLSDVTVDNVEVPGTDGAPDVRMRIYLPTTEEPLPIIYDIHPGGFVLGSINMNDNANRRMAIELPAVIASVDYRLAPETPFPGGLEDCYAGLRWLSTHADMIQGDAERIALHGYSAGGGLAAALALLARDRGGPAIAFQYLGAPQLDDRLTTGSMAQFADAPFLGSGAAQRSWEAYLGINVPGSQAVSQYAAPARATVLAGLPSAYIAVAEFDPLRDEGIAYAHALLAAGISVELHLFPGTFHSSFIVDTAEISRRELTEKVAVLRRATRRKS